MFIILKKKRIRKKVRYEELVACETKYHELLEEQDQQTERKNNLLHFMNVRSDLLKTPTSIRRNQNDHSWNFSFEVDSSSYKSQEDSRSSPSLDSSLNAAYKDIVQDCSSFTVDIISSGLEEVTAAKLNNLKNRDNQIVSKISAKVDDDSNIAFRFEIKNGKDGVALTDKNNSGFAECEFVVVLLKDNGEEHKKLTLKSDYLKVMFAQDSGRIVSMKLLNVYDFSASFNMKFFQNDELSQQNFPSVVSLN